MVRRGSSVVLLAGALLSCSGGGPPAAPATTTTGPPAPTLPAEVAAGTAALLLGDATYELTVASCVLEPVTDPATGVTTELAVDATGPAGAALTVRRTSFSAALVTVTETVFFTDGDQVALESERVDAGGRIVDLRAPGAFDSLIEVEGGNVTAAGRFGFAGARGPEPTDVEGSLLLRCP